MIPPSHDDFLAATLPALDLVYNLSRKLVSGTEEAEDLVQETYMRAFDAWERGRKPRKVEPWMATICLNLGRSWLRRASKRREVLGLPEEATSNQTNVEGDAIERVTKDAVHRALWSLPDEQRVAITLMDINGFTASQVARMTNSPRGTVLARVHRGRKRLAGLLQNEAVSHET